MTTHFKIILCALCILMGCRARLKNDLDPVKVACGDGLKDSDKNLIAFRPPTAKLSDFYPVAYSLLDGASEKNGVSETGCLSIDKGFAGLVLARNADGSKTANYRISEDEAHLEVVIIPVQNNNLNRELWDRCGARGLQRIQGSQILFKIYKSGKNFFDPDEVKFFNDEGFMKQEVSEKGCFSLTPTELKQGVSLRVPDGTSRKISSRDLDILSTDSLQPVYFCSGKQYWDPTKLACINNRPEKVVDLFSTEDNKKAMELLTTLGCTSSIETGVTFCPAPTNFMAMDALYSALESASSAVINDKKMAYFPETKELFDHTIQYIMRDVEGSPLYREASLRESRYRVQLGSLTGMTFDSVISLTFTQRYEAFENMLNFIKSPDNLALLQKSGIINVLFYDRNGRIPPDSAYLNFNNTETELKTYLLSIAPQ